MRFHVFQHVPFEGLGSIHDWLRTRKAVVTTTAFYAVPVIPSLNEIDALIVLGGPMSVNDEAELPWLREEKRFVCDAITSGMPVLGICLGAQLMATSLGARVYPGAHKEIGWFPVQSCMPNQPTFCFPDRCEVFHWHGETFGLPPGAVHLAKSEGCQHQAFQVGERAIGLQFHLETTPQSADEIITYCRHELIPGRFVQSESQLRAITSQHYSEINRLMDRILDYITRNV